jgi:hypothetical protein
MVSILTESEMFEIIKKNFTDDLYKWMKIEFSDICSCGDIYINELLDNLNSVYNIKDNTELICDPKYIYYIDHIYGAYINNYIKG